MMSDAKLLLERGYGLFCSFRTEKRIAAGDAGAGGAYLSCLADDIFLTFYARFVGKDQVIPLFHLGERTVIAASLAAAAYKEHQFTTLAAMLTAVRQRAPEQRATFHLFHVYGYAETI